MTTHTILLYVADVAASARYYAAVLDAKPVEESPGFALFVLAPGLSLGLWRRDAVTPAPTAAGGGGEVGIRVASRAEVDATYTTWVARGATIVLAPTSDRDFSGTFVAVDPDGHRLRVFALAETA